MKFRFLFATFLISFCLNAQKGVKSEPEYYSYPLENFYQPIHIRVNAVLLKRTDGSGSFNLKNPEEQKLFNQFLENNNDVLSKLIKPDGDMSACGNVTEFMSDTKIRLDFNIIEIRSTHYWNYLNSGSVPEEKKFAGFSPSDRWYIKPLDDSISNLNIPKAINIYFTENGKRFDELLRKKGEGYDLAGNRAGEFPSNTDLHSSSQIHIPNVYTAYLMQRYQSPKNYNTSWEETKYWWLGGAGVAHEFGHNFGLAHSSEYYNSNQCTYTIMNQKHDAKRNWLPPNEIRKMHWNLTRTNLIQFATPESAYGTTWVLSQNTEWTKPRRFYHNFELSKGITLTITDSIILPPNSNVKLNKDSKIIFKGKGRIVDAYGKEYTNYQKAPNAVIRKE